MGWKDYEMLDSTKEVVTEKEVQQIRQKYNLPMEVKTKKSLGLVNKRGRADIFKKKCMQQNNSQYLY